MNADVIHFANLSYELLPIYRVDPVSFQALLAYTAVHYASEHGQSNTPAAVRLEVQALQMLQSRLEQTDNRYRNGTLLAVAMMANLAASPSRQNL